MHFLKNLTFEQGNFDSFKYFVLDWSINVHEHKWWFLYCLCFVWLINLDINQIDWIGLSAWLDLTLQNENSQISFALKSFLLVVAFNWNKRIENVLNRHFQSIEYISTNYWLVWSTRIQCLDALWPCLSYSFRVSIISRIILKLDYPASTRRITTNFQHAEQFLQKSCSIIITSR